MIILYHLAAISTAISPQLPEVRFTPAGRSAVARDLNRRWRSYLDFSSSLDGPPAKLIDLDQREEREFGSVILARFNADYKDKLSRELLQFNVLYLTPFVGDRVYGVYATPVIESKNGIEYKFFPSLIYYFDRETSNFIEVRSSEY